MGTNIFLKLSRQNDLIPAKKWDQQGVSEKCAGCRHYITRTHAHRNMREDWLLAGTPALFNTNINSIILIQLFSQTGQSFSVEKKAPKKATCIL
jgi:hypothetical protein